MHSAENFDERRFACAIFSDQGMDLAAVQIEVHAVERRHAGKALCDSRSCKASVPVRPARFIITSSWNSGCRSSNERAAPRIARGAAAQRYFARDRVGRHDAAVSIQIGLFTSDLNIAPLGAQLYCVTESPFSL